MSIPQVMYWKLANLFLILLTIVFLFVLLTAFPNRPALGWMIGSGSLLILGPALRKLATKRNISLSFRPSNDLPGRPNQ